MTPGAFGVPEDIELGLAYSSVRPSTLELAVSGWYLRWAFEKVIFTGHLKIGPFLGSNAHDLRLNIYDIMS